MIIVLTGGTGLIGRALGPKLISKNHKIHLLSRKILKAPPYPCRQFLWPEARAEPPAEAFPKNEDYGALHFLGEPVSRWPWTSARKEKIFSSRVDGSRCLIAALKKQPRAPLFFLSAGATGIYGARGAERLTENSPIPRKNLFLQKVCGSWEEEALKAGAICRTLIFRLGAVLSHKKGFLPAHSRLPLIPLILSRKASWLSWIAIEDLISLILWAMETETARGIYNAASPHPIPLKSFYSILAGQKKIKALFRPPLPLFLIKNLGGEMTRNLLASCRAFPEKAQKEGFQFKNPDLEAYLKNLK